MTLALDRDLLACLLDDRGLTPRERAVAFQLGSFSARNGKTEVEVLEALEEILREQVDEYCEALWVQAERWAAGLFGSLDDLRKALTGEDDARLDEVLHDYRDATVAGHRSTTLATLMLFAGTLPHEELLLGPHWSN